MEKQLWQLRLLAQQTGEYGGRVGPYWCDREGSWVDVWQKDTPPYAAKVGIWRKNFHDPVFAVARIADIPRVNRLDMGEKALAEYAEAEAIRVAFPEIETLATE